MSSQGASSLRSPSPAHKPAPTSSKPKPVSHICLTCSWGSRSCWAVGPCHWVLPAPTSPWPRTRRPAPSSSADMQSSADQRPHRFRFFSAVWSASAGTGPCQPRSRRGASQGAGWPGISGRRAAQSRDPSLARILGRLGELCDGAVGKFEAARVACKAQQKIYLKWTLSLHNSAKERLHPGCWGDTTTRKPVRRLTRH